MIHDRVSKVDFQSARENIYNDAAAWLKRYIQETAKSVFFVWNFHEFEKLTDTISESTRGMNQNGATWLKIKVYLESCKTATQQK